MDKNSIMLLLKPGCNSIELSWQLVAKKGCGFFPSSHKVEKVRTEGLKWNMGNSDQEIGSLDWKEFISSSNELVDDNIVVENSHDLIFVASL